MIADLGQVLATGKKVFKAVATSDKYLDKFMNISVISKVNACHLGNLSLERLFTSVLLNYILNFGRNFLALRA